MTKREWTIVVPYDKRHYGSDRTALRAWFSHFGADPQATVTLHSDIGPIAAQDFLQTLDWPEGRSQLSSPNLTPAQDAAWTHHVHVCLASTTAISKIMLGEHKCEWFDLQSALSKRQNAELRSNARLLTQWIDQQIAAR